MGSEEGTVSPAVKVVEATAAPEAIGPYSAGVQAWVGGGVVFVSGQLPLDPSSGQMVEGDVRGLVRQALANGLAVVEASGSSLQQIVKVTVFVTNLDDFGLVNEAYAEFFRDWHPARSVVEVSRLPRNSPLEIDMIAVLADATRH
jgi:2-iminobutanoate/2-iminopropanoate deaminase